MMRSIEQRLQALEQRTAQERGPLIVLYPGEEIPPGTPEGAVIIQVRYEDRRVDEGH